MPEVVVGEDGCAQRCEEGFGRERAEILAVEPLELGEVEDRAAQRDALEVEPLEHLGEREDVAFLDVEAISICVGCAMPPPIRPRKLMHGLGQEAGLAVVDERDGIFALGDLALVEIAQQRHVPEARQLPAEGLVEQDVFRGGGDPLLGADDVGDPHQVVVDDIGEVIGGEAVGLHQHLVVDVVVRRR